MDSKGLIIFKGATITVISAIFIMASSAAFSAFFIKGNMYESYFLLFISFVLSASSAFIGIRSIKFTVAWLLIPTILLVGGSLIFNIVATNFFPQHSFDEGPGLIVMFCYFALLIHAFASWCIALVSKSWKSLRFISWYIVIVLVLSAIMFYITEIMPEQREKTRTEKLRIQYDYVNFNYPGMILKYPYGRGGQSNAITEFYTCPRAKTESYSGILISQEPFISVERDTRDEEFQNIPRKPYRVISISQEPFFSDEGFPNIDSSYGMQPIDIKGVSKAFIAKKVLADELLILHYKNIMIKMSLEGDCQVSLVDIANTISQQ